MNGVWVVYIWDHGYNMVAVFGEEINALRYAATKFVSYIDRKKDPYHPSDDHYSVTFLAYGTTLQGAKEAGLLS